MLCRKGDRIVFRQHNHSRQGFTLIELMVASGISAVLMWSIFMIFDSSNKLAGMLEGEFEVRQNARAVFARMELDLTSAFLDCKGNYFEAGSDKLKLLSASPCTDLDGTKAVNHLFSEVAYSASSGVLYRTLDFDGRTDSTVSAGSHSDNLLCDGVSDFSLAYWDPKGSAEFGTGDRWKTSMDTVKNGKGYLPSAVEVTLELTYPAMNWDKPRDQVEVRRTFFNLIPVGQGR